MRLWTLHPKYLDAKGLVALWREGLLAKAVLSGNTTGYMRHPQLLRFQRTAAPVFYICEYLHDVLDEAKIRGYRFDEAKLPKRRRALPSIKETVGQVLFEWHHLSDKLRIRAPERFHCLSGISEPEVHPLFEIVPGEVRDWERGVTSSREV